MSETPREFSTDDPRPWPLTQSRARVWFWFLATAAATSFVIGLLLGIYWNP